ncbi:MAG: SprB repeat-containing protein [Bacteroidales bacterium]|nr:SprB repeat-containing protein [Bacteroidales bacterium]
MKKLILLSILLFGCLTNYAQINPQYYEHSFYKVTFHKPLIGWMVRDTRKIKDNDNKIVYTIITANGNEHVYTEKRALSDIPDSTYYLTEEPITLKYKTSQKIGLDLLFYDNSIEANDAWEHKFTEGKYKSYGIDQFGDFEYGWDNVDGDYGIFHCTTKISYEIFRCECRDAGDTLCSGTELNCKYNFELPFNSSVYFAKKNNPKTKYLLKKIAQGQTEFTVSTKDITDSIGYNEPFDLYIFAGSGDFDFFKLNLGITHFGKIIEEVPYHRDDIYIKDNQLVIKNSQQYKNCNFVFEGKTVSKNYKAINDNHKPQFIPTGQYQLQISDKNDNYCQVNLDAYVPEIKYNYLDKKIDEFTHWHNEDTTQAINLKIYNVNNNSLKDSITITESYPTNSNHTFKYKPGNKTIEENLTYYNKEHVQTDSTIPLFATPYYITCYPDLDSITIVPKDTLSIPTIITINKDSLKAYPSIYVDVKPIPADCFYDMHKVKIDSISGGLSNGYNYTIIGNNSETEIHQGDTIVIPNNNQKEFSYKLAFYDANISTEDSIHGGKKARSTSTNETYVIMPDTLGVDKYEITDVACHGDATGKIQILSLKYADPNRPISYLWNTNSTQNFIDNLPIGTYSLKLSDGVCSVNSEYEIKQPNQLIFKKFEANDASCFGYNDGSIIVSPDGGVKPYTYWLNDSIVSPNITKLIAADYHITVADSNNCFIEKDTKINEPPQVINNNIIHNYSICQDSELEIDAGDFADYIWKNPEGKTLKDKNILKLNNASPEGEYYLKTIRYDDCFAEDTITIVQSKESLKMNFLLPSDIYNDDYAKIVETSSHELDSLKWSFSENLIGDFPKDSTTLTISTNALDKLSTYKIKLTGYYKGCISTVTKNLNISNLTRPEEEYIPDFYDSDEILDCRIGPNPNNGNFTLFLDLDCAKDAVLTIYSISSYKYVLREKLVGLQNYEHSINQNLQQGLYILEVKTPKSIRRIKFEVTK